MRTGGAFRLSIVLFFAGIGAYAACRTDDPKTPPNSPIPEIPKPSDPSPSPFGDAGGGSTSTH